MTEKQFDRLVNGLLLMLGLVIAAIVAIIALGHAGEMPTELPAAIPTIVVGLIGLHVKAPT